MSASAPDTKASAASVKNTTPRSRVILASLVGTTIEFYDFYIYATFIIGLLPTYHQIGLWAPTMLTIMRFCQGLGLGGEWSGAALLASEYAEEGKRARAAMWPQLGAPIGFVLANGFMLLLTSWISFNSATDGKTLDHPFLVWGWRIPFLMSIVMVAVGLYVRFKLEETPVFAKAAANNEKIQGTFIMVACYVLFYLMTAWVLSYGIGKVEKGGLAIPYREFLVIQLISIIGFAIFIPISGWLADKYGRRTQQLWTTIAMAVFGLCFGLFISPSVVGTGQNANVAVVTFFIFIGMCLMGLSFGSMSAYLPELYPTNVRYTASGIAYNVASILGAALTPFVAVWLNTSYGVAAVGGYLAFASILSVVFILLTHETRDVDMNAVSTTK